MSILGSERTRAASVDILGVRFHTGDNQEVVEQLLLWIDEKSHRMVITAGPEFVMMARSHPRVQQIARAADLVTPDGVGVLWAARRKQVPLRERVTGVELVQQLLRTAADRKQSLRVFLLGASQTSLDAALDRLRRSYSSHEFAGRNGYFQPSELDEVLAEVAAFEPNVWLVGIGQPRQEELIHDALGKLPPCVAIGVGGSIDVWGGTVKRAPRLMQRLNIEWLYRLVTQPSRWRRQLALPRFAWQVLFGADSPD